MENMELTSITQKSSKENRQFWLYLEGWLSIGLNITLFIAKYWIGIVTGSVAIMADAWHTLSDSLTSVIVLVGTKLSAKDPDEEHPFGHGRAELIASIIIGVLLGIVAFNFLVESISKLSHRESASFSMVAVIIFLVSVVVKEGIAQFSLRVGKKFDSKALIADGWHHRSDAIASAIIVVGIFAGRYFWWIDGVMGIIVALLIFYATFDILKQAINPLIGEKPSEEIVKNIHLIADRIINNDYNIHHAHIHQYGLNTELTFHVQFQFSITFEAAHNLITLFEETLREELEIEATIHFEPADKQSL